MRNINCNGCGVLLGMPLGWDYVNCPSCRRTTFLKSATCSGCGLALGGKSGWDFVICPFCNKATVLSSLPKASSPDILFAIVFLILLFFINSLYGFAFWILCFIISSDKRFPLILLGISFFIWKSLN